MQGRKRSEGEKEWKKKQSRTKKENKWWVPIHDWLRVDMWMVNVTIHKGLY